MARAHIVWFGTVVEFSHPEATQLSATVGSGAAAAGVLTAALGGMGITGPAAVISGIATALLTLGSAALNQCNSKNQRGIYLYVLWVGVPWCRHR